MKTLSQAINKYDNIFIAGDFNIDVSNENDKNTSYLSDLWDTFNLKNLMTKPTCYKSLKRTIIDLILTNKPRSFQKTPVCGTSDCHKLTFTVLKSTFKNLPPKQITYRNYKNFNETKFCQDLNQELLKGEMCSHDINF